MELWWPKYLVEVFDAIKHEKPDAHKESCLILDPEIELDGNDILEGEVYDWSELEVHS